MSDWTGVQPEDLAGAIERGEPCTAHTCRGCGRAWIAPQSFPSVCRDCFVEKTIETLFPGLR